MSAICRDRRGFAARANATASSSLTQLAVSFRGIVTWSSVAVWFAISACRFSIVSSTFSLNASSLAIDAMTVSVALSQWIVSLTAFLSFRRFFCRRIRTVARFCVERDTAGLLHRFSSRIPPHLRDLSCIWIVRRSTTSSPLYMFCVYWCFVSGLDPHA